MSNQEVNKDPRKVSDIIISLEEKIVLLIKTIAANDMNNKLILDRLNKLLNQGGVSPSATPDTQPSVQPNIERVISLPPPPMAVVEQTPFVDVNKEPAKPKKRTTKSATKGDSKEDGGKIPVGQRVTDNNGKDLFMADVTVTNLDNNEISNFKTNAVGKWQAYLGVGTYSVHISKTIDPNGLHKIESLQHIEVTPQMKSLQLPIIIIKR